METIKIMDYDGDVHQFDNLQDAKHFVWSEVVNTSNLNKDSSLEDLIKATEGELEIFTFWRDED